ncbi:MAG: peptide chain release factor N(5)-glutamine methyltransferase [Sphaerochaeta sp.]|jgi:release factor glutamine methyltransferase|nr:peptide chain release factor N(5)-glutamine methyltransferase [Sphaerochaeta sp.]MCH3920934.1 peptide chain release factor N(5)-glutamine methyltransferase [Sphaerochaeta sp.]
MAWRTWEAIRFVRRALTEASVTPTADLEAKLLVEHATGLSPTELVTRRDQLLDDNEETELRNLLSKRLSHIPIAYLLGHREFYGLDFLVDPRVLIPRPDTETLVETVLRVTTPSPSLRLLDVCTGSGCVGITLSRELHCPVTLADISTDALAVADKNAQRFCDVPYTLVQSDLFSHIDGIFDVIVSNPPYLAPSWIEEADPQVRKEPILALDGGSDDGLDLIRRLVPAAVEHLTPGGKLFLECDDRQINAAKRLLLANGFVNEYSEKDLTGQERVVWGEIACTTS